MTERATSSIGCDKFDSEVDDFDDWVGLFERAVKLATNGTDLPKLYKEWLPLKLDKTAYTAYNNCDLTKTWDELKTQLKELLVDPTAQYQWQARHLTVTWDGVESFHSLAARVKRSVNKYDKEMGEEYKKREYFFRFKEALPDEPYQTAIDIGIPTDKRTIEAAKEMALRTQLTQVNKKAAGKLTLAAASIHEDRAAGIEASLSGISTQLETIASHCRKTDEKITRVDEKVTKLDDRVRALENDRTRSRAWSGGRNRFDSSRDRFDSSRERFDKGRSSGSGPPAKTVQWKSDAKPDGARGGSFRGARRGGKFQSRGNAAGGSRYHNCQSCDCQDDETEDYRAIETEDEMDGDEDEEAPDEVTDLAARLAHVILNNHQEN